MIDFARLILKASEKLDGQGTDAKDAALLARLRAAEAVAEAGNALRLAIAHDLIWQNRDDEDKAWDATFALKAAIENFKDAFDTWQKAKGEA